MAGAVSAQGPCEGEAIQYLNMAKSAVQSVGFDDFVANMNDITARDRKNIYISVLFLWVFKPYFPESLIMT